MTKRLVWSSIAICALFAQQALGCCAMVPNAFSAKFRGQRNIIVWDPDTRTQHFIRQASFESRADDLGFIAPSPSIPTLGEAKRGVFMKVLQPIVDRERFRNELNKWFVFGQSKSSPKKSSVISVLYVAGYEATIIKASDARALESWMKANNYSTDESIVEWTEFYIKKGWYLTLFKVKNYEGRLATGIVRMTFKTDEPFNPYYVPESNIGESRYELAVSFIGPGVYKQKDDGNLGSFHADIAASIPPDQVAEIAADIGIDRLPSNPVVTQFGDRKFPSVHATDDIYFEKASDTPYGEESEKRWRVAAKAVPVGVITLAGFLLYLKYRKRRLGVLR